MDSLFYLVCGDTHKNMAKREDIQHENKTAIYILCRPTGTIGKPFCRQGRAQSLL